MLISELLNRNVRRYPSREALIFENVRLTYQDLYSRVCAFSDSLWRLGINKGDKIAVMLDNCNQYIELYFAITERGSIIVPLNTKLACRELEYIINDSGATAIISCKKYIPILNIIAKKMKEVKAVISIDYEEDVLCYENLISNGNSERPEFVYMDDNDIAFIMYTSGTTGSPKGAMLSHKNIYNNASNLCWAYENITPDERTLNIAPLYHCAAAGIFMAHVYGGATNVIISGFNPKAILEVVEKEKVTNFWAAPSMINALVNYEDLKKYDLSSLRKISYAAAPMPVPLLKKSIDHFGPIFFQMYGLTEASPCLTVLPVRDNIPESSNKKLESIGKECLNTQVRVVNPEGQDVSAGEVGEIIGKGDNIMVGYWNRPEETKEALKEGWLYTGDLATVDAEGYIYIVDRKKDMIISGGENIYSMEVEKIIYEHPSVMEVAVIGIPDPVWGEAVTAFIVTNKGMELTETEIINHCKANMASYKKPKYVQFIDALPKNPSGKILKRQLRYELFPGKKEIKYG